MRSLRISLRTLAGYRNPGRMMLDRVLEYHPNGEVEELRRMLIECGFRVEFPRPSILFARRPGFWE